MSTIIEGVEFDPVELDNIPNDWRAYKEQAAAMGRIAEDCRKYGKPQSAAVFYAYQRYCEAQSNALAWHALGEETKRWAWIHRADEIFEALPEWAKWA